MGFSRTISSRPFKWIARNRRRLQIAGLAAVVVAMLIWSPSVKVILLLLLILGGYEFVLGLTEMSDELDQGNADVDANSRDRDVAKSVEA